MKQKIYQVDAFAEKVFTGNPAAVCPLQAWLPDEVLQNIGLENNLAETAFYVKRGEHYEIRWFTPSVEVDLCGHATLAAAFVLFFLEGFEGKTIRFFSPRSGELTVTRNEDQLTLNFPADTFNEANLSEALSAGFNIRPSHAFKGKTDYMLVFKNEDEVRRIIPAFDAIAKIDGRGVIVTAKGDDVDFVSRFFAPQSGVNEDPVTGSAHTTLTPYWAKQLGKTDLTARQLSPRTGSLRCRFLEDRVEITGQARLYMTGEIFL